MIKYYEPKKESDLINDFDIKNMIRIGDKSSNGDVYKARNKQDGKIYALKFQTFKSEEQLQQFKTEYIHIKRLSAHPNIVTYYESYLYEEGKFKMKSYKYVIMMELCDYSLTKLIGKKFNPKQIKDYIYQILKGMIEMKWKHIYHRDIKPENILVKDNILKLTDFGLSKVTKDLQMTNSICGTPLYFSPQLMNYNKHHDIEKSDIFSIGLTFLQLALGLSDEQIDGLNEPGGDFKIIKLLKHFKDFQLKKLLEGMLQFSESKRINLAECVIILNETNIPTINHHRQTYRKLEDKQIQRVSPYDKLMKNIILDKKMKEQINNNISDKQKLKQLQRHKKQQSYTSQIEEFIQNKNDNDQINQINPQHESVQYWNNKKFKNLENDTDTHLLVEFRSIENLYKNPQYKRNANIDLKYSIKIIDQNNEPITDEKSYECSSQGIIKLQNQIKKSQNNLQMNINDINDQGNFNIYHEDYFETSQTYLKSLNQDLYVEIVIFQEQVEIFDLKIPLINQQEDPQNLILNQYKLKCQGTGEELNVNIGSLIPQYKEKQYSETEVIQINIQEIQNYHQFNPVMVDFLMISDKGIVLDDYDSYIINKADPDECTDPITKKDCAVIDDEIKIGTTPERLKDVYKYNFEQIYMIFIFILKVNKSSNNSQSSLNNSPTQQRYSQEEYGWFAHQVFDSHSGRFKQGVFSPQIWKYPIQKELPFDMKEIKKSQSIFKFEVNVAQITQQQVQEEIIQNNTNNSQDLNNFMKEQQIVQDGKKEIRKSFFNMKKSISNPQFTYGRQNNSKNNSKYIKNNNINKQIYSNNEQFSENLNDYEEQNEDEENSEEEEEEQNESIQDNSLNKALDFRIKRVQLKKISSNPQQTNKILKKNSEQLY